LYEIMTREMNIEEGGNEEDGWKDTGRNRA
jgi:hypothetical protein